MIDAAALAIATGAASNVVAYLLQGHADAIRNRIAAIFRHGTEEEQITARDVLDEHSAALADRRFDEQNASAQWSALLSAFLATHPSAWSEIEALKASPLTLTNTVNIGAQHNHGDGTFINGNHHGDITVNGRREQ